MCHWELTQWEARPKLQVHKRSAMQLKTRLVRLPDDRLALALTGGCRRGRCKCGYLYEPNLETGIDLPLASSSTRSPDSREQASLKDALCLLAKLGQTVTGTLVSASVNFLMGCAHSARAQPARPPGGAQCHGAKRPMWTRRSLFY